MFKKTLEYRLISELIKSMDLDEMLFNFRCFGDRIATFNYSENGMNIEINIIHEDEEFYHVEEVNCLLGKDKITYFEFSDFTSEDRQSISWSLNELSTLN